MSVYTTGYNCPNCGAPFNGTKVCDYCGGSTLKCYMEYYKGYFPPPKYQSDPSAWESEHHYAWSEQKEMRKE